MIWAVVSPAGLLLCSCSSLSDQPRNSSGAVSYSVVWQNDGVPGAVAVATLCYTLVHVWSGNLMLLFAAAACGFCWGLLYCLLPKRLPALILSHALWDAAAFVFFPF